LKEKEKRFSISSGRFKFEVQHPERQRRSRIKLLITQTSYTPKLNSPTENAFA